jgi:hypothetical protein
LSEVYRICNAYARRLMAISEDKDKHFENTIKLEDDLYLSWNTDLPCLHPTFMGRRCHEGIFISPDLEVSFMVLDDLVNGLRPIHISVINNNATLYRLGFLLRDKDKQNEMLIYPMSVDAEHFIKQENDYRDLVITYISTLMANVFGAPHEVSPEEPTEESPCPF